MSMPIISPSSTTPCQAITDLLETIALQEAGLAHIINAEGEKIQQVLDMARADRPCVNVSDLIAVNQAVNDTLTKVIKLEMVLEFKLEEINRLECPNCPPCPDDDGGNHHPCKKG